jgi:hypothetical protein
MAASSAVAGAHGRSLARVVVTVHSSCTARDKDAGVRAAAALSQQMLKPKIEATGSPQRSVPALGQIRPSHFGTFQSGVSQTAVGQVHTDQEDRVPQVSPLKVCFAKYRTAQVNADQRSVPSADAAEISIDKTGTVEHGTIKPCTREVRLRKIGPP